MKTMFHNEITGKLSDFSGLFAFPFLFSLVFPKFKKTIHLFSGILFVFWNSEFSQVTINTLNNIGLPVIRTVDYSDNIALLSILLSYRLLSNKVNYKVKPIFQKTLVVISCLAFMATTLPPHENRKFVNIDKEYRFNFSKRELISRLNMVQIKEVRNINKYSGTVDFNSETNVFHYNGKSDTLALIIDQNKIENQDTIIFKTSFSEIIITGNKTESQLKLLTVYKIVPIFKDKNYREKAIKQFENKIIKKIRKYR